MVWFLLGAEVNKFYSEVISTDKQGDIAFQFPKRDLDGDNIVDFRDSDSDGIPNEFEKSYNGLSEHRTNAINENGLTFEEFQKELDSLEQK